MSKKSSAGTFYIIYDIESSAENNIHVPILLISKQVCSLCIREEDDNFKCNFCERKHMEFEGTDCVKEFLNYVTKLKNKKLPKITAIAHFSSGFDHCFVLKELLSNARNLGRHKPEIIQTGSKVTLIEYQDIRFIDSLNFFGTALRNLPKVFGLKKDLTKGYFPHLFTSFENLNYVGDMPDKEYYGVSDMKPEDATVFMDWYNLEKSKNNVFDFKKELKYYCEQDVNVLLQACIKFENLFEDFTDLKPLACSVTIASSCMQVFRRSFLIPDTIPVIPPTGYRFANPMSHISLEWLAYRQSLLDPEDGQIIHAGNGREHRIERYHVDGFLESKNICFEFLGCRWHFCEKCYPDRNPDLLHRFEATIKKENRLKELGYTVISIWECEYNQLKKQNPEIVKNYDKTIFMEPLKPRDAFFGGRTCSFKRIYDAKEDEKIVYKDFCSLYPYVCKHALYPIGHPEVYVRDECPPVETVCGLVKCTILPPKRLMFGVIPVRSKENKLVFPLCRTCLEELNQESCNHADSERQLTGTWVSTEIIYALSRGYVITQVFEVWDYKKSRQLSKDTTGLFSQYIDTFLKGKIEASGWPPNCITEEDKNAYIKSIKDSEGIELDPSNIESNPGLREIYKSLLNHFWGKWAQRTDLRKTVFIDNFAEFISIYNNPDVCDTEIIDIDSDNALVRYKPAGNEEASLRYTNVVIAAFTTANARLKLLEALEKVGDFNALYCDTHSILYTIKKDSDPLQSGSSLGELKMN